MLEHGRIKKMKHTDYTHNIIMTFKIPNKSSIMKRLLFLACILCACISASFAQSKTTATPEQSKNTIEIENIDKQLVELKTQYLSTKSPEILTQYHELRTRRNELTGVKPAQKKAKRVHVRHSINSDKLRKIDTKSPKTKKQ